VFVSKKVTSGRMGKGAVEIGGYLKSASALSCAISGSESADNVLGLPGGSLIQIFWPLI